MRKILFCLQIFSVSLIITGCSITAKKTGDKGITSEGMNKAREIMLLSGIEASVIPSIKVMEKCKGKIFQPLNNISGGGKICSDKDATEEWLAMPSQGNKRYQYRKISDNEVISGTESTDLVRCKMYQARCAIMNEEEFKKASNVPESSLKKVEEKEYNKPEYVTPSGERTAEGKRLFMEESQRLTANRKMEDLIRLSSSIASQCLKNGGKILKPLDIKNGGGKICTLSEIEGQWKTLPQLTNQNYYLKYKVVNEKTITGGSDNEDIITCAVENNSCKVF